MRLSADYRSMPALLTFWHRRSRRGAPTSTLNSRIEVCPPALWPSSLTLWGRLQRWWQAHSGRAAPVNRLALAREEFLKALNGLQGEEAEALQGRIERTRSLRELWHLRSTLYGLVSMQCSQGLAEQRLVRLNRHFPTRAPRSGLMPLLP